MCNMRTILFSVLFLITFASTFACKGCISLDEHNFDKIIPRFKAVLVKFDVAYPYGDKHDVFTTFAGEIIANQDLLLAEVGVKDYGERENEELAKKYGVRGKDDLPAVKLFLGSINDPITFTEKDFTIENVRTFIRDNTDMYIGLPGCLEKFDKLASEFVISSNKEEKLKAIEELAAESVPEEKDAIKTYLVFMKKVIENGTNFVKQEQSRLKKILKEGRLTEKKKTELNFKINVLHSFRIPKDEL